MRVGKPKILVYDLEISQTKFTVENYGRKLYSPYLRSKDIVRPKTILSAAWKYLGDDKVNVISVKHTDVFNDEGIVRVLHPLILEADYLIAHHNDGFDIKEFNGRALYYGLAPTQKPPWECIDTLKIARKYFKLDANDLSFLARFLELDPKDDSPNWDKIHKGDEQEIRYMRQYNRQDVITLEQVYHKLKAWDARPSINIGAIIDKRDEEGKRVDLCPSCGGGHIIHCGYKTNRAKTKTKKNMQCKDCLRQFLVGDWIHILKMPPKQSKYYRPRS